MFTLVFLKPKLSSAPASELRELLKNHGQEKNIWKKKKDYTALIQNTSYSLVHPTLFESGKNTEGGGGAATWDAWWRQAGVLRARRASGAVPDPAAGGC